MPDATNSAVMSARQRGRDVGQHQVVRTLSMLKKRGQSVGAGNEVPHPDVEGEGDVQSAVIQRSHSQLSFRVDGQEVEVFSGSRSMPSSRRASPDIRDRHREVRAASMQPSRRSGRADSPDELAAIASIRAALRTLGMDLVELES